MLCMTYKHPGDKDAYAQGEDEIPFWSEPSFQVHLHEHDDINFLSLYWY
jgi:hypothetical protein